MKQEEGMNFRIPDLIGKYLREDISEEEFLVLEAWKGENAANRDLWHRLTDRAYVGGQLRKWDDAEVSGRMWQQLEQTIRSREGTSKKSYFSWLQVAALLLAVMAIGGWLYHKNTNERPAGLTHVQKMADRDVVARSAGRKQGVVLMLGNGERVSLTSLSRNTLREQDGTSIVNKDGSLEYAADDSIGNKAGGADVVMNSVTTPLGLTFQLSLVDGTKVWLSAGSSISYPTIFRENTRQVTVRGEAYFEVAPDKSKPFFVVTAKSRIEVLGTSFNIRSYEDEPFEKTSLLEGAVRVSSVRMGDVRVLKPGFEASIGSGGVQVGKANVNDAVAWKNGLLVFDNQTLESLMHNLTRWYGIQVTFADSAIKNYHFTGRLQRYGRVNELLEIIGQTSKVKFELWQNRVLVKNQDK